jgi:hypothetical protein
MELTRSGSRPSGEGPAEYFSGSVRIDPLNSPPDPARVAMALVTFRVPGDRGLVEEVRAGDVIWVQPGEKHWHGATPTTGMSHIAVQEKLNGSPRDWLEHLTDDQNQR